MKVHRTEDGWLYDGGHWLVAYFNETGELKLRVDCMNARVTSPEVPPCRLGRDTCLVKEEFGRHNRALLARDVTIAAVRLPAPIAYRLSDPADDGGGLLCPAVEIRVPLGADAHLLATVSEQAWATERTHHHILRWVQSEIEADLA